MEKYHHLDLEWLQLDMDKKFISLEVVTQKFNNVFQIHMSLTQRLYIGNTYNINQKSNLFFKKFKYNFI